MDVLYIIGNGLDISLGMKTDYQSFYDFYKSQQTKDPDILKMKESIEAGRYQTWADLEAGLGEYTRSIESEDVFLKCLNDIKHSLGYFISEQFKKKDYIISSSFARDFSIPYTFLDDQVKEAFINRFPPHQVSYDLQIITLNYTNTIEEIFDNIHGPQMPDLLHLHGSLKEGLVMGVSDENQIANEGFRKSREIVEEFVKPSFNDACLNTNNSKAEKWIKQSDLIVIFGSSLGETDRKWWRLIGNRLQNERLSFMLLFFAFDKDMGQDIETHPNHRRRWMEHYQNLLLSKFEIPDEKRNLVLSRICIGINKPIFRMEMNKKVDNT